MDTGTQVLRVPYGQQPGQVVVEAVAPIAILTKWRAMAEAVGRMVVVAAEVVKTRLVVVYKVMVETGLMGSLSSPTRRSRRRSRPALGTRWHTYS